MHPTCIPTTRPRYIPTTPMLNTNANSHAKIASMINDLNTVNRSDLVPFPIDWKIFPERTPKGINNIKKHNMRNASTMLGPKTVLSAE